MVTAVSAVRCLSELATCPAGDRCDSSEGQEEGVGVLNKLLANGDAFSP